MSSDRNSKSPEQEKQTEQQTCRKTKNKTDQFKFRSTRIDHVVVQCRKHQARYQNSRQFGTMIRKIFFSNEYHAVQHQQSENKFFVHSASNVGDSTVPPDRRLGIRNGHRSYRIVARNNFVNRISRKVQDDTQPQDSTTIPNKTCGGKFHRSDLR